MGTNEILALALGFFLGVAVAVKLVAWLLVAAAKLLISWVNKAMI